MSATDRRPRIRPISLWANDRIAMFHGDGSERCLVCGSRGPTSFYVGQHGRLNTEGLPERFPVCSAEHALMWMRWVWTRALDDDEDALLAMHKTQI